MKRVILLRPSGPRNVGMILRVTRNFGPCEMALVRPERASMLVHPEFEQMAHGAEDIRDEIMQFDSLEEALADCTHSIGFTARVRGHRTRRDWREMVPEYTPIGDDPQRKLALAFGNEVTGITREEAELMQELSHVRTSQEHTSLNLAVSVAVALSSLFTGTEVFKFEPGGTEISGEQREFLKVRMRAVFAGQVATSEQAARDISASIDRVFSRATMETRDARAWHLMLKALGSKMTPVELGLDPSPKDGRRKDALERADKKAQRDES